MVYGLADAVVLGARQGILFWLLLGLIYGLFNMARAGQLSAWAAWPGERAATLRR